MGEKAFVVKAGAAEIKSLRHGRGTVEMLVGAHSGAAMVDLHINMIAPNSAPGPRHLHSVCENVYYVLSGSGRIEAGGLHYEVSSGDAVFIPPGVPHSATNSGKEPLRILEVYAPVGVDFIEVDQ